MAPKRDAEKTRAYVERTARQTATECLAFRARALSRRLTSLYDDALRPLGLKPSQMNVMTVVAASAGNARLAKLADMIALEPSSLSRIVDVMRRNGWLDVQPDPDDVRARIVVLTDAGAALYAEAIPLWRKAQRQARDLLGEDGVDAFVDVANRSLSFKAP